MLYQRVLLLLTLWSCGRRFLEISLVPENVLSVHVEKGLSIDCKKEIEHERERQNREGKKSARDRKPDIGRYISKPTGHLSQLTVNKCCVRLCRQLYASQWLLDGLHLIVFTLLTAAVARLLLMSIQSSPFSLLPSTASL